MAEIKPFKGLHYDTEKAGEYKDLVAPPYDVISKEMKEDLYSASEYNIVRLSLGKENPSDGPHDNKYIRAGKYLDSWLSSGVMLRDGSPSIYVHMQDYLFDGRPARRTGFFTLVRIDEESDKFVIPHEKTHSKPKKDRLLLMEKVKANLSPVFSLFDDSTTEIMDTLKDLADKEEPVIDFTLQGMRSRLWQVSDEEVIKRISLEMSEKKVFIADGHHRYEVAKTYRDMRRKEKGYGGQADHVMMYLTDLSDSSDLTVMATHRAVRSDSWKWDEEGKSRLEEFFELSEFSGLQELLDSMETSDPCEGVLGMMAGNYYFMMKLKDKALIKDLMPQEKKEVWKELDVSVLHSAVLDRLLSIGSVEGEITYLRDAEEAESLVLDGSHKAAFFLRPTPVWQMKAIAESGDRMPQKSTYFYPKVLTGLVVNKFE